MTLLSASIATSIGMHSFSLLFLIITPGLFVITSLSVRTLHSITQLYLHVHILAWACVCTTFLLFQFLVLSVLNTVNIQELCRVILSIHSSPECGILRLGGQQFLHVVYTTGT